MNINLINRMRFLALIGGILGLIIGFLLSSFRFGWITPGAEVSHGPAAPTGIEFTDGLAFLLVFTLAFGVSIVATRLKNPAPQAAIWLAGGILALLGSRATFSVIALFTFPIPALLLLLAGLIALRQAGLKAVLPILGVGGVIFLVGSSAFFTLFARDDPVCWALIRTETGEEVWEPRPFDTTSPTVSFDPAPGEALAWECTSDVISLSESLNSMSLWGLALLALAGILPHWENSFRILITNQERQNEP